MVDVDAHPELEKKMSGSQTNDGHDGFVFFGQPQILDEEIDEVVACLRSGWIGTGPRVAEFEEDFAASKHVERTSQPLGHVPPHYS